MTAAGLRDARAYDCRLDGALEAILQHMMAPDLPTARVARPLRGPKHILPGPRARRIRVFAGERIWKLHSAIAGRQIRSVQLLDVDKLFLQHRNDGLRQHREAIFRAFAMTDRDLATLKIEIFEAQAQTLHQAQPTAVKQLGHQAVHAGKLRQQRLNLRAGKHNRQTPWPLGPWDVAEWRQVVVQDLAIQKQQGAQGDVLGRGRDLLLDRQLGEVGADLCSAHGGGMPFVVKENEALDDLAVGGFGTGAEVFEAGDRADLLEKCSGGHDNLLAVDAPLLIREGYRDHRGRMVAWHRPGAQHARAAELRLA